MHDGQTAPESNFSTLIFDGTDLRLALLDISIFALICIKMDEFNILNIRLNRFFPLYILMTLVCDIILLVFRSSLSNKFVLSVRLQVKWAVYNFT